MKSVSFEQVLDPTHEAEAWKGIKGVIHGILGKRDPQYQTSVAHMLKYFEVIGVNMSLKIHFLHHHLDVLENQNPKETDEHGEQSHQVMMPFEKR